MNTKRNMAQNGKPTRFVSRTAPQAHPIFLIKPIQYPTPNNPHLNQPATVIRPILSSNINLPIARPPLVRRLLRPAIIRPLPPRLVTNENLLNRIDSVSIQTRTPIRESSIESSLPTLSTLSSNHEEIQTKKSCCYCLPCCQSKEQQQQSIRKSERITDRPIYNYPNFKLKTRTIYIIIILLFIFFLIVIILLIVLIVRR